MNISTHFSELLSISTLSFDALAWFFPLAVLPSLTMAAPEDVYVSSFLPLSTKMINSYLAIPTTRSGPSQRP
jgi:hypothetical protein